MLAGKSSSETKPSANLAEGIPASESTKKQAGETKAIAALAVGMSRMTLEKAQAVVAAAEKNPDLYGDLVAKMDKTKKIDPVYKELLRRQADESAPKSAPENFDPSAPRSGGKDDGWQVRAALRKIFGGC